ncbi:MAG: hypothetical protein IJP53_02520 [Synergistaceae bacterium]|nr:hypothetical protein [Synergistaceae bacterium]MBR0094147.1 hypothetical protein [Synergistaceae bacterium]
MASQNNSLGYIIIEGTESQIRGAALVTDVKGFPLDFARTDPLRPDALARILYGESFGKYAKEKLILESLLDAIEIQPQLWICNDGDLLAPLRITSKIKTVMLDESPHVPLDAPGHVETTAEPGVFFMQADPSGAPLRAEFPDGTRPEEVQQVAACLAEAAASMVILEPFNRLQKALNFLATGRS